MHSWIEISQRRYPEIRADNRLLCTIQVMRKDRHPSVLEQISVSRQSGRRVVFFLVRAIAAMWRVSLSSSI